MRAEPEVERASVIIEDFNHHFGNIPWTDKDRIHRILSEELPAKVREDKAYQNAMQYNTDQQNVKIESDAAVLRAIVGFLKDDSQLYKEFMGNPEFKRWLNEVIFAETFEADADREDDATG